ncbi:MAG: PASTA domain-containing protein [Bacteroidota bacterium]
MQRFSVVGIAAHPAKGQEQQQTHESDDYIGMDVRDARQKAKNRSFSVVIRDSLYIVGKPSNVVLEQDPTPLSRVKENRTIYLTITKFNADEKLLPELRGNYDYAIYARKLKTRQINARIKEEVFDNNQAPNTILYLYYNGKKITEADISKGVKIPMGSTLDFVVTTRGSTTVETPDLVCMRYSEARFMVENYKLNVGSIIEDQTITNKETAYVWKQVPQYAASKKIRMGAFVDLYLTQYKPDQCD